MHTLVGVSMVFSTLTMALLAMPSTASAQSYGYPGSIGYQGRLKDTSGDVVTDGTYDFQFNFYSAASGGSGLAAADIDVDDISVDNGFFSLAVPLGTDIGDFVDDLYLEVRVKADAAGSYDTVGRIQVLKTPYSVFSQAVQTNTSDPSNAFEGRMYYNATANEFRVYNGSSWDALATSASLNLDGAYNSFGATASKITVDAAQGQTGGFEFELSATNNPDLIFDTQGTGDVIFQDAGVAWLTLSDGQAITSTGTGAISLSSDVASNFTTTAGDLTLLADTGSVIVKGDEAASDAVMLDADTTSGSGIYLDAYESGVNESGAVTIDARTLDINLVGSASSHGVDIDVSGSGSPINMDTSDGDIALTAAGSTGDIYLTSSQSEIYLRTSTDSKSINIADNDVAVTLNLATGTGNDSINLANNSSGTKSVTIGNNTSSSTLDLNAGTGGVLVDSTGAISLDAAANSNFTVAGADLTITTTTSGEVDITAAGLLDINGAANMDVDVTGTYTLDTTTSATITTGTTYGVDATGAATIDSDATLTMGGAGVAIASDGGDLDLTGDGTNDIDVVNTGAAIDVDSGTFTLDTTGIFSIDGVGASNVTATSGNLTLRTTTSGDLNLMSADMTYMSAGANLDIDVVGLYDMQSTGVFSIDGVGTSNVTATSGDLTLSTATSGNLLLSSAAEADVTSAGLVDINAGANLDVDVTGTYDMLASSTFSIDGTGASNVTATSGNLTLATATSGNLVGSSAGTIDLDSTGSTTIDIADGGIFSLDVATTVSDTALGNNISVAAHDGTNAQTLVIELTNAADDVDDFTIRTVGNEGDLLLTSGDSLELDSVDKLSINSSAGTIGIGDDNVSQGINIGTDGARTIQVGSNNATVWLESDAGEMLVDAAGIDIDLTETIDIDGGTPGANNAIDIHFTLGDDNTDNSVAAIELALTSAATNDTDVLYGFNAGNLSSAQAGITETALNIGTGWDNGIVLGSGNIQLNDGIPLIFGTDSDYLTRYNATDLLLSNVTAGTVSANIGRAMFVYGADSTNLGMAANQQVFEIGRGASTPSSGNWVELFAVDEDGDVEVLGDVNVGGGDLTSTTALNVTSGDTTALNLIAGVNGLDSGENISMVAQNVLLTAAGSLSLPGGQGLDTIGAGALNLGTSNATSINVGTTGVTAISFLTDGSGDSEVVLPMDSVGANEVLDDSLSFDHLGDNITLDASTTFNLGASAFIFDANGTGDFLVRDAGADVFRINDSGVSTFSSDVNFTLAGTENVLIASDLAGSVNAAQINGTPSTTAGVANGLSISQLDSANINGFDSAIVIDNADADLAITRGVLMTSTGGGGITTAIDVSAAAIGAALAAGANDLGGTNWSVTGSDGSISFAGGDFDVDASGNITDVTAITAGGTITGQAGAGIAGGLVSLNHDAGFNTQINTGTSTGTVTIGGGGGTVAINSSDWDISTSGAITGAAFDANGAGNTLTNVENADLLADTLDFTAISDSLTLDVLTAITGSAGNSLSYTYTPNTDTIDSGMSYTLGAGGGNGTDRQTMIAVNANNNGSTWTGLNNYYSGIAINNLANPSASTSVLEAGLAIGSGWDTNLYFEDDTAMITITDTGGSLIDWVEEDTGGTPNQLMRLAEGTNEGHLTVTGSINVGDNDAINVGAGSDLVIDHTGSLSRIVNGTGSLVINNTAGNLVLQSSNSGSHVITQLGEAAGSSEFRIVDSTGTNVVFKVDSDGDTTTKGKAILEANAQTGLLTGSAINPIAAHVSVTGSGAVTLTSNPSISDGVEGQTLILRGAHATNKVTLNDHDSVVSGVQLGAATRELGNGDTLGLMYDGTDWVEMWFQGGIGADYAEYYKVSSGVAMGDVVSLTDEYARVEKAVSGAGTKAIGIVSTDPAEVIGNEFPGELVMPVALAGRVPVKVNGENGAIAVGDRVGLSSVAGYGAKAVAEGWTIGTAMESFDGAGDGTIRVFVSTGWYEPATSLQGGSSDAVAMADETLEVGDHVFAGSVSVAEHLYGSRDMAGRARINAGDNSVRVTFENEYDSLPIVTFSVRSAEHVPGRLWISDESTTGFTINHSAGSTTPDNIELNWIAIGAIEPVVSISNGETETIGVTVSEAPAPAPVPEPEVPAQEEPAAEEEPVVEEEVPAEEPVEEEPVVEEPVVEEPAAEEEPVVEEEVPVEEPVEEEPVVEEPVVE